MNRESAHEFLEIKSQKRIERLTGVAQGSCVTTCVTTHKKRRHLDGQFLKNSGIKKYDSAKAVFTLPGKGRGKGRNFYN